MYGAIFVKHQIRELAQFAEFVFDIFNIKTFYERQSSFYVDGHYFSAEVINVEINISIADYVGFEDYAYTVDIALEKKPLEIREQLNNYFTDAVARILVKNGCDVAVPETTKKNSRVFIYRMNPSSVSYDDEIIVTAR